MTELERWNRIRELGHRITEWREAHPVAELPPVDTWEPDSRLRDDAVRFAAALEGEAQERARYSRKTAPIAAPAIEGYRIEGLAGSGGGGAVFRAERLQSAEPRTVALKLAHAWLDTDGRARFLREHRILAMLDHPGIARALDAGITEANQPYLVMEYVDGTPLDEHCRRNRLDTRSRVRLLAEVCDIVEAAHQKLIVHLDLKPANILITHDDAVKVLDFGISKLLDPAAGSTTTRPLTPVYASPEQLRGEPVSTLCDTYSAGLILYELLTGSWPQIGRESLAALAERAAEAGDQRPLAKALTEVAAEEQRSTREELGRFLAGDLQAIVSKALAPAPRRYQTMRDFAADLRRYLDGRPVLARRQTFFYRLERFASRNRAAIAVSTLAFALLAAAAGYAWSEHLQGARRLEEARAMAGYLLFDLYDRINDLPGSTAVRADMARQAQAQLERLAALSGADQELRLEAAAGFNRLAEIQGVSGTSSLGQTEAAESSLNSARTLLAAILAQSPGHRPALVESARNASLAAKLRTWNLRSPAAATPLIEQARRDLEQSRDPANANWLRASASLAVQQADLAEFNRDFREETRLAAAGLAALDTWPPHLRTSADWLLRRVALLKRRGNASYYQRQFDAALDSYRQARLELTKFDAANPNRPEILYALMDMSYQMAYCFGDLAQPQSMLDLTRDSIRIAEKLLEFDPYNQALARSYWNKRQALAESLTQLSRHSEAVAEEESVLQARLAARRAQPDSRLAEEDVLYTQATFATILSKAGKAAQACELARETLEASRSLHSSGGMTPKNWAEQQQTLGRVLASCP